MTLKKALCKKLVDLRLLEGWVGFRWRGELPSEKSAKLSWLVRGDQINQMLLVVGFVVVFCSAINASIIPLPLAVVGVFLGGGLMMRTILSLSYNVSEELRWDFRQLRRELEVGETYELSFSFCRVSAQVTLLMLVNTIAQCEITMMDKTKSWDEIGIASQQREEAKRKFNEKHQFFAKFGLTEDKKVYFERAKK